jgi:hypothetical protein
MTSASVKKGDPRQPFGFYGISQRAGGGKFFCDGVRHPSSPDISV